MSEENPPLTCKEIKAIISYLGFKLASQKGSHEQWVLIKGNSKLKITVDCPKAPFSHDLIKSMAKQAGSSQKEDIKVALKHQARFDGFFITLEWV